ncbi:MAG TPA: polysaccharide deacetylase family protein [Clostridiales bacterium]|nr:polysaccharide deacetylase family protein [Clostridiales bacterium]
MTKIRKTAKISKAAKMAKIKRIISMVLVIIFLASSIAWIGYTCVNKGTKGKKENKMPDGNKGYNEGIDNKYNEDNEDNEDNEGSVDISDGLIGKYNTGNDNGSGECSEEGEEGNGKSEEGRKGKDKSESKNNGKNVGSGQHGEIATELSQPEIDFEKVKPNEAGKIMVVMFHNFVETFTPTKYDKGEYTITFKAFEELLHNLYDKGYRLINLKDYIEDNISVPAGCIPVIFTFDDGTQGQFNLVKENGELKANKHSAVGIMEEFCSYYPDFGLKGTFFVNLGLSTFSGEGTLSERLEYLIGKGFEIGNHTLNHISLTDVRSSDKLQQEIGGNQKKMYELVPGYTMYSFSLPYGAPSNELMEYVVRGEYEGVKYENLGILEVGADPALSPVNKKLNLLSIHRVRSPGINPVKFDLNWWLENLLKEDEYMSDGNPDTITIPESKADSIDTANLKGKKLIVYD